MTRELTRTPQSTAYCRSEKAEPAQAASEQNSERRLRGNCIIRQGWTIDATVYCLYIRVSTCDAFGLDESKPPGNASLDG